MNKPIDTTTLLAVNKAANDWLEQTRQGQKKAMPNYSPIPDEPVQMSLVMVEAIIHALNAVNSRSLSTPGPDLLESLKEMVQMVGYLAPEKFDDAEHEHEFNASLDRARAAIQKADCATCQDCSWDGNWSFDATSPMGEQDTFGTYLEEADAREAMKRLEKKGYTDFSAPYQN
jgi:hypothetical protein